MKKVIVSILLLSSICFSNEFKKADFQYQYDFGNKNCLKLNDIQKGVLIENLKSGIFWAPNEPIISMDGEKINVLYGKNKDNIMVEMVFVSSYKLCQEVIKKLN